jgi:hypothetical protein
MSSLRRAASNLCRLNLYSLDLSSVCDTVPFSLSFSHNLQYINTLAARLSEVQHLSFEVEATLVKVRVYSQLQHRRRTTDKDDAVLHWW